MEAKTPVTVDLDLTARYRAAIEARLAEETPRVPFRHGDRFRDYDEYLDARNEARFDRDRDAR